MNKRTIKWLTDQGCIISKDDTVWTVDGDYVGLTTLTKDKFADKVLYDHKLTQLQSLDTADGKASGNSIQIGFSEEEQKWYGWSHRGVGSFGIGDVVKAGTVTCNSSRYPTKAGFKCKTLEDCKRCAMAFADALD